MRRHPHRYYARLLLVPWLLAGATAHAQTKSPGGPTPPALEREAANKAAAEALFRRGKTLYTEGKSLEAFEVYRAAWDLRKTYEIAGNLGNVALELGKAREAAEYLAYSISMFPANGSPEKLAMLGAALAEARSRVATVRVEVRPSKETNNQGGGATALGDEQLAERLPVGREIFLDPGHYTIKATLPGYGGGERAIQVKEGAVETVVLTLEPIKILDPGKLPKKVRAAPEVTAAPAWRVPVLAAGLGVAAAGLALGIGSAVHSGARRADVNDAWVKLSDPADDGSACHPTGSGDRALCDELRAAESDARIFRALSIAGFIASGVGAVTGIGPFIYTGASSSSGPRAQSVMTFSLGLAPGAGTASVRGSF